MVNDDKTWSESEENARRAITHAKIRMLTELRSGTDRQVLWLLFAGALQIFGVIALAFITVVAVSGWGYSDVQQARDAMKDEPGVAELLDALDAEGLLKSRDDVVKLTTYYRASCDLKDGTQPSPDAMRAQFAKDLEVTITDAQAKALEPVRAEFCAAQ